MGDGQWSKLTNCRVITCTHIGLVYQASLSLTHLTRFFSTSSVSLFTVDGNKIAQSTGIDLLLQSNFDLKINDTKYCVEVPKEGKCHQTFVVGLQLAANIILLLFSLVQSNKGLILFS